jgi:RND family efflux transporter MFP subunit
MKRNKHAFRAAALWATALSAAISGCSERAVQPAAKREAISGVTLIAVQRTTIPDTLEAVGTVRAAQTTQVASQVMGTVTQIRVHEGDRVQAGQVLAVTDDSQPRAAVQQTIAASMAAQKEVEAAETESALADSTFRRYQQLYDKKSVSPQEFDEVKGRCASAGAHLEMARAVVEQANAALAQARTSLGYTIIHAPFAGIITEKRADVGTMAAPGVPLFTVEDVRRYRLEATVDERDMAFLHIGQPASVVLDAFGEAELHGNVAQIIPAADPASRTFVVKIDLPTDARLRSGLFGRARISRGERSALVIPQTAIVQRGQLQGVYIVDASRAARLAYITLGRTIGQQVEVLSGMAPGDRLIAEPGDRDLGGKQVAMNQ